MYRMLLWQRGFGVVMARAKAPLRAVDASERAPGKPRSLKSAVELSERELLVTIRAKIADELDAGVPPHTLAPLSRQLRDIDKEIRLLDVRAKDAADEAGVSGDVDWDSSAI